MRPRLIITLVFTLSALLLAVPAGTAAAAPATGPAAVSSSSPASASAAGSSAANSAAGVCSLSGLVRADGTRCPGKVRLRPQWLGTSLLQNPVDVFKNVVGGAAAGAIKSVALFVIGGWVASGAESALKETAKVIDATTSPELTNSWFSSSYWKIAGIAALLTLPFLCAAAVHALVRSDLGLLARAAFGYLPLSLLAVGIASQLTMLLLAGTDEMCSIIASAAAHADSVFLANTSVAAIADSVATGDPFVAFLAAVITVMATLSLWIELLVRDAAVYVIVLMLPLFFAAMVWPARRTLAIRAIETLIALILSKFAIVAVLSLGGSALGHSTIPGAAAVLTGATLVLLAAFSPWALLRVLPLHEVASAAAGGLSQGPRQTLATATDTAMRFAEGALALGAEGAEWLGPQLPPASAASPRGGDRASDGHRSAATEPEPAADPSWGEPVDADVAEPVTSAMASDSPGARERTADAAAGSPSDQPRLAPGGQPGSNEEASAAGSQAPVGIPFLDEAAGGGPLVTVGDDLLLLANEREASADAADTVADGPVSTVPDPEPPLTAPPPLPADGDPIGLPALPPASAGPQSLAAEPEPAAVAPPPAGGLELPAVAPPPAGGPELPPVAPPPAGGLGRFDGRDDGERR